MKQIARPIRLSAIKGVHDLVRGSTPREEICHFLQSMKLTPHVKVRGRRRLYDMRKTAGTILREHAERDERRIIMTSFFPIPPMMRT
jgi:hypothetical protein